MKTKDVSVGRVYAVKVSNRIAPVKIAEISKFGGWLGLNLTTDRFIRIRSAAKLRWEMERRTWNGRERWMPVHTFEVFLDTADFENAEFQAWLQRHDVSATIHATINLGSPEYRYTASSRKALEKLVDFGWGSEDIYKEAIREIR